MVLNRRALGRDRAVSTAATTCTAWVAHRHHRNSDVLAAGQGEVVDDAVAAWLQTEFQPAKARPPHVHSHLAVVGQVGDNAFGGFDPNRVLVG